MPRFSVAHALAQGWITPAEVQLAQPSLARGKGTAKAKGAVPDKPRKQDLEGQEQALLVTWFDCAYPEIAGLLLHIPNGGYRKNAFEGWRLKQQGVRAGVSDLLLPVARAAHHGLWIEFKATAPNDTKVTERQQDWLARMTKEGYRAEVCRGFLEAQRCVQSYLV